MSSCSGRRVSARSMCQIPTVCRFPSHLCVEETPMRERNGKYECSLCGMRVEIPAEAGPRVVIRTSGGAGAMRTLVYKGETVHACPLRRSTLMPA